MKNIKLKAGIFNMTDEEYFALPAVSQSDVKNALESERKFFENWAGNLNKVSKEPTDAMLFGSALHCLVLEPEEFKSRFNVLPEGTNLRTNAGKAIRDEMLATGKPLLKSEQMEELYEIAKSVRNNVRVEKMLNNTVKEQAIVWFDEEYGVWCKAKADMVNHHYLADLKTTEDASAEGFNSSVVKYGYHIQDTWYMRGMRALNKPHQAFMFVAVEKKPPYLVCTHVLDDTYRVIAEEQIREGISIIKEAMKAKDIRELESVNDEIKIQSPPQWLLNKYDLAA